MSLREIALAEYHKREEAQARKNEETRLETHKVDVEFLTKILTSPEHPADLAPDFEHGTVIADGITFGVKRIDGQREMVIWDKCPECGRSVASPALWSLADIGAQVENFNPDFTHDCQLHLDMTLCKPETAEERLLAALRDVISSYQPQPI